MSSSEQDLAARLTEAASAVSEALSPAEVATVRRYQALDRTYELVSAVLRGKLLPEELTAEQSAEVLNIIDELDAATERWQLPEAVRVYRGQRSVARVFGDHRRRIGSELQAESFLSTTIHRQVAIDEFTAPPGAGGPVLLDVAVPPGTHALWVPPIGDPDLAYQGELLLSRRTRLVVRAEQEEAGILVLDCEVLL